MKSSGRDELLDEGPPASSGEKVRVALVIFDVMRRAVLSARTTTLVDVGVG